MSSINTVRARLQGLYNTAAKNGINIDFQTGQYNKAGVNYPSFTDIQDYTVVRTGTNGLSYSQEFDNAAWTKFGGSVITPDVTVAPNGTTTGDLYVRGSTSASYLIRTPAKAAVALTYTYSVYVKRYNCNYVSLRIQGTYSARTDVIFNINTPSVIAVTNYNGFTNGSATITPVGNEWLRCTLTATTDTTTQLTVVTGCSASQVGGVDSTDTSSTAGVYLWGAQVEPYSTVGVYIPTTTAAITFAPTTFAPNLDGTYSSFQANTLRKTNAGITNEPQRTNLALYSGDVSNAEWSTTSAAKNVTGVPDMLGGTGAGLIVASGASGSHFITVNASTSISYTSGTVYTLSAYVRMGTQRYVQLTAASTAFGTGQYSNFDLQTGTCTAAVGVSGTSRIMYRGGGWYRITHTVAATSTNTGVAFSVCFISTGTDGRAPSNTLATSFYVWGAQVEVGGSATTYIPTVNLTVTRAADVLTNTGGVSVSRAGYNMLTYSQDMTNAIWGSNPASVTVNGTGVTPVRTANFAQAPDGTFTATRLQLSLAGGTTSTDRSGIYQGTTFTASTTYTGSVWVRSNTNTNYVVTIENQVNATTTPRIFTVTPEWQRVSGVATSTGTSGSFRIYLQGGNTPVNSDSADILVWGAQVEIGQLVGGYQPTTSSAITTGTNINFSECKDGTIVQYGPNVPRITDKGLLVEEARTNGVINSSMQGAVLGVIGSGGSAPTGWAIGSFTGSTREVTEIGVEYGMPYFDLRWSGTNSTGSQVNTGVTFNSETSWPAAAVGQTWTGSVYVKLTKGSVVPLQTSRLFLEIQDLNSAGSYLASSSLAMNSTALNNDANPTRYSWTRTATDATTGRMGMKLGFIADNAVPFDFTIRIYCPQLEQGLAASSPILSFNEANGRTRLVESPVLTGLGNTLPQYRTNYIQNNTNVGASPGVLPTGWTVTGNLGLTTTVVGTGAANNIPYADIRISGTTNNAGNYDLRFNTAKTALAQSGQTWTGSLYACLVGGTVAPGRITVWGANGGNYIEGTITANNVNGNAFVQSSVTRTFANTSTNNALFFFEMPLANNTVVDATYRIGGVQLEQGAVATALIPTSGSIVTVGAPITITASADITSGDSVNRRIIQLDDGTSSNRIIALRGANTLVSVIDQNGYRYTSPSQSGKTGARVLKTATRIRGDQLAVAFDNSAVANTVAYPPVGLNRIIFGAGQSSSEPLNGYVQKVSTSIDTTDAQLQYMDSPRALRGVSRDINLDFINRSYYMMGNFYYENILSLPNITFTRASEGFAENKAGQLIRFGVGQPRITDKGWLAEGTRINIVQYSQDLDNAYWSKTTTTVNANTSVAPDGTLTADTAVFTNNASLIYKTSAVPAAGTYVWSQYVKADTLTSFTMGVDVSSNGRRVVFDLAAGTVGSSTVVGTGSTVSSLTGSIQKMANGWYRCAVAFVTTDVNNIAIIVAGGGNLIIWGQQLESTSAGHVSSYIPTLGSSATRTGDVMVFFSTTQFTPPYTMITSTEFANIANTEQYIITARNSSGGDTATLRKNNADLARGNVTLSANTVGANPAATFTGAGVVKMAIRVRPTSFRVAANAQMSAETTAPGAGSTFDRIYIGSAGGSGEAFGYIQNIIITGDTTDYQLQLATIN